MKGPSAERSKNKKYENLGVEGVVLQDYDEDIDAMMDNILNSEKRPTSGQLGADSRFSCGRFLGLFMMFLSATFFLSMTTAISYLGRTIEGEKYPATQLVLIRASTCLLLTFVWLRRSGESFRPKDKRTRNILVARSCVGVGGMLGGWFLISQIPFSDATVIIFSAPFWTMVLARVILKESFTKLDGIALAFGFLGVLLVARPGSNSDEEQQTTSGAARGVVILIGVLGAICSAGTNLLVRKLKHVHALLTIFYLMIAASFGSIIVAVIKQDKFLFPRNSSEFFLILLISTFGFLGQLFKTEGLKRENAGPGAMMR